MLYRKTLMVVAQAGLGPRAQRPQYCGRCWVGGPGPYDRGEGLRQTLQATGKKDLSVRKQLFRRFGAIAQT